MWKQVAYPNFGDAAVTVWQEIVNLPTSVTIGSIPIISTNIYNFVAPLSLVAEVRFCNPGVAVRFCQGAPVLRG